MPFTKIFGTTDGSYATATNWQPINLRSSAYAWTASGSGTNEYYLRTAASADPGFAAKPGSVYINAASATEGTVGSLAASTWGYGDNDSLGYSTVYVRLSDGADPDGKAFGYVQFFQIPQAGEHVRLTADSGSITGGYDQSAVAIGDFIVEDGYNGTIGDAPTSTTSAVYLKIDPDRFEFNGDDTAYIDLGSAAIDATIHGTTNASNGEYGLYLKGSAIAVLNAIGGNVGVAVLGGETATITTVRSMNKAVNLTLGKGCTVTTHDHYEGSAVVRCDVTTTVLYGGTIRSEEDGDMTTVTQKGGGYIYASSGDITTYNLYAGTLDERQSGAARTISTFNIYRGSSRLLRNKEAVTHTSDVLNDSLSLSVGP